MTGLPQPAWRQIANPFAPIEVIEPEQLERIHDASMRILENFGLEILNAEALDILAARPSIAPTAACASTAGWCWSMSPRRRRSFTLHAGIPPMICASARTTSTSS